MAASGGNTMYVKKRRDVKAKQTTNNNQLARESET